MRRTIWIGNSGLGWDIGMLVFMNTLGGGRIDWEAGGIPGVTPSLLAVDAVDMTLTPAGTGGS